MGAAIVYGIKIAITVATMAAFVSAIVTICSLVQSFAVPTVFGEIISLVGIYLPFDGSIVFRILIEIITAFVTFLVARKVYQLLSTVQRDA